MTREKDTGVSMPTPEDIDATKHFWDSFGNLETEMSARMIVQLCQTRGAGWATFTQSEVDALEPRGDFYFNGLVPKYITETAGQFQVTALFVAKCAAASPVKRK